MEGERRRLAPPPDNVDISRIAATFYENCKVPRRRPWDVFATGPPGAKE